MSSAENAEVENALSAFSNFFQMLKGNEWLSRISKEEMKNCLRAAKCVEQVLETLESTDSLGNFIDLLPDVYGLTVEQMRSVSDVVLEMVLSASGVALPSARVCVYEYLRLCGSDRFEHVLATVIFQSEIYRVLLDYLASSDNAAEHSGSMLQSQVLSHMWKVESDSSKLNELLRSWLASDESGQNMTVAILVCIITY